MRYFRVNIEVDIKAHDREVAERRAQLLYSDLGRHPWIVEVLPNGIEERIPLTAAARKP